MIFFSDFDGTLTKEGRELTREFFDILDLIAKHDHELVIVSGRSLSWGHFFLTHYYISRFVCVIYLPVCRTPGRRLRLIV